MPLWINGGDMNVSTDNFFRDFTWERITFEESLRRTIGYYDSLGWRECKYGMPDQRERELLADIISNHSAH